MYRGRRQQTGLCIADSQVTQDRYQGLGMPDSPAEEGTSGLVARWAMK